MYNIRSKHGKNIHIKDLGIRLIGTDKKGVLVNEYVLEHSQDIHRLKDELIITSDGINKTGTKNLVSTIEELESLPDIFPGESAILIQKDEEGNILAAIEYLWDEKLNTWVPLSGGSGEGGAPPYIHPSTHPASMIIESDERQFITKQQKESLNEKADKTFVSTELNKKVDKTTLITELDKKANKNELDNYALKSEIPDISIKADKVFVDTELDKKVNKSELTNYALKTEIPDVSGKADKTFVTTELNKKVDKEILVDYALKSEIPDIDGKADKIDVYTKKEIDDKIANLNPGEGGNDTSHDHNNLYYQKSETYNKAEVEGLIDGIPNELPNYTIDHSGKVLGVNGSGTLEWQTKTSASAISPINTYSVSVENSTAKFLVKSFGEGITISKIDNAKYSINIPENVSIKSLYIDFDLKEVQSNGMIEFKWNKIGDPNIETPIYKVYNTSNNGIENSSIIAKLSSSVGEFDPKYYTLTNVTTGVKLFISLIW